MVLALQYENNTIFIGHEMNNGELSVQKKTITKTIDILRMRRRQC